MHIPEDKIKETSRRSLVDKMLLQLRAALEVWNYKEADECATIVASLFDQCLSDFDDDVINAGSMLVARAFVSRAETTSAEAERCIPLAEAQFARVRKTNIFIAELTALTACIVSLKEGPDAALRHLAGVTTPYGIRTRIALLLNQSNVREAIVLIDGLELHEWWCDVAVAAYALHGNLEKAQEVIRWAVRLPNQNRHLQCCVRFAQGILSLVHQAHQQHDSMMPKDVTELERGQLFIAAETLAPVLQLIRVAGRPTSGLDLAALRLVWQINFLLQRRNAAAEALSLMAHETPVPVDVARGVMTHFIEAPTDLPERLRHDHPGDLEANALAAAIESSSFGRHAEAFAKAKDLATLADTDAKKDELFRLFHTLWQNLEGPLLMECEAIIRALVAHNVLLQTAFEASVALRHGDADTAINLLDRQKAMDDPYWVQIRSNACLLKNQLSEAVDFLLPLAEKTLEPGLLLKSGDLAYQAKRFDVAARCYEILVKAQPGNLPVHSNLAHIYTFELRDLEKAAVHFRVMHAAEPKNPMHTLNLAICLAQIFRPDESMALYDELAQLDNPPLSVVLGRAQLQHSMGHPDKALMSLDQFRSQFWEDSAFVLTYMSAAYAAGREEAAHEALVALNRLQEAGSVTPEVFRSIPQDEGLEIFKKSFKQSQDHNVYFHAEMIQGRMPWVWADQMASTAIYWGWRTRTQEMSWIGDDPTNRARFCIYATNGFHARISEQGKSVVLPLECPPVGTKIVADVSALLTLHRLGLLDAAAEHFGEVLVPAGYLLTILEDSRTMVLHQRSRQQNAEHIAKQINTGRIVVQAEKEKTPVGLAVVDEYADSKGHPYRLADLTQPVYAAGILTDDNLTRLSRVSAKPTAVDEDHPTLARFQNVLVDLTTLETLAQADLLDAVCGFYKVHITSADQREMTQRLGAIALQEETRHWHMDLWTQLRNDPRFKFVPHTIPKSIQIDDKEDKDFLPFLSSFISQEAKLPLLADDRVCQAFTLNSIEVPFAAFGSDTLISQLTADGKLDAGKAAEMLRQLIVWRYRFLVLPPEILKAFADLNQENPLGQALREVAAYVHDCMRDQGLFGNREKTEMGESMAARLYLSWVRTIAEFVVMVWADKNFSLDKAAALTKWVCQELLPSAPRALEAPAKVKMGDLTPRILLSSALLATTGHPGENRMADAMKALKECLQLTNDEYHRIVLGILNDTGKTASES